VIASLVSQWWSLSSNTFHSLITRFGKASIMDGEALAANGVENSVL